MLITASEKGLFLICLLVKGCRLMKQWLKFFFFIFSLSSFQGSLWTFLPGQNNGGPRSPASPQAQARGGRGLGTEGAAQHAEIWRRQIRWQRHREALSHGPKGKFAVIKRKMREIKWLLYSFSQTFIYLFFYYLGCLHLRDERSSKLPFFLLHSA